ncbi:hypothetical protein BDV40DRAFT_312124 [Aspergillus tamarii]|uniref:Major facilitator superfamily (MFS) profile domain-containing protein n=1 Tax=Aspergillus tamarii TaxID=41984 RepID=A0A5N6V9W2_ASPTM|nr:hypothetical protein BDV40DRAFT_312124 [Aspergillus tamarii]
MDTEPGHRTPPASAPAIPRRLQACERCWKRKQKVLTDDVCDRQLPACTTCVEAGAQCAPRRVPIGSATEEGSGLSHAAVPNYVETLKRKRDELDAQFRQQRARRESDDSVPPQPSPNMETTSEGTPGDLKQTPSTAPTSFSERSVQATMGEIGFLSRNAMAEPRDETRGFPQELAMGSMVRAALAISGEDPSQSRDLCHHRRTFVTMMGPATGISKEFAAPYLSRFLDHVGVMFLHLDRRELQDEFDSYFDARREQPSHTNGPNSGTAFFEFRVYMAVAIGMLLSPETGSELLATGLHAAATERLAIIIEQRDCVKSLHCMWLLALYSMFSSLGGSTWHLVGLAMKKCISFRFHRELYPDSDMSQEELNRRRSIFWAFYVLDRTISCVMDRPFSIEDEDILVQLPVYNSTSKTVAEFDFGCHIIMHARLLSTVRSSSSRGRLYHYRNLSHWRDLPKSVKEFAPGNSALSASVKQLTCRALTQIVLLTRGAQSNGGIVGDTRAIEHDVVDGCQAYINDAYYYSEQGKLAASFIDGFDLFAAGVLVICLPALSSLAGPSRETATISKCTALLTTIGERFPSLKVLRKLLLALSSHIETMAPGITEPSSTAGPSTAEVKPTVYVLDTFPPKAIEYAKTLFNIIQPQDEEFKSWRQNARALLVRSSYVTADDIASCPNLIAIGKHGVGIDKINQDACTQRGIKILNTPGANARDVAELVIALALSVARGIRSITSRQMLKPVPKETCNGLTLHQKTIGIIGMGNIGRTVAEIFRGGFDANIVAYDAYMPEDVWSHIPHTRAKSVDEVLVQADVLSVHIPLTAETRDMISYQQIRAMKPDAILINAARGGIINEADLTRALTEGYLWGAGLDCHEQEPPSHEKNSPTMPSHTLHVAFDTICDKQCFPVRATKGTVRQIFSTSWRCYNPGLGNPTGMADKHIPLFINGKSIGACTSKGLKEETDFCVMATYKNRSSGERARPFGEIPLETKQSSFPTNSHTMGLISDAKRAMQDAPKEVFNAYVLMCTCFFALSGVSKGFDEGNIASVVTQAHFRARFGVDTQTEEEYANTKGWLVSIATAGAVFGCLGCSPINDRFGRRWTLRIATVIYIAGVLGQGLSGGNLSGLYASRFIAGLGIGPLSIVPPVYITEISPKAIRGLLTVLFAACQQLGVVLGFFINYGVTKQYPGVDEQWMLPTLLQIVPAVVWGFGTFLCSESPRWLLYKGQREQAAGTLSKLRHLPRDHSLILSELAGMDAQILHETEAVSNATVWDLLKETFVPVENRRRFFLIFMATLFSQWSGANAITQYSPQIFGYLGINGDEAKFLATGIYGVVKFVSTVCFALFIVDFIGRRRSLMTGIGLQLITLIFVGAYLGVTSHLSTDEIGATPSASRASTAAIVAIFLHAVAWSIGWFSIPYLVGSEIFPIRIRSLNMSISMAFHWAFYFGCSRAMPSLLAATHKWGAFVFFSCICLISLIYVFFAMPDTTGRSLEELDSLFQRPWYTVYQVAYPSRDEIQVERLEDKLSADGTSKHIEEA